uniref:Uncharacterized protein n=1 Tax=Rhizophora mucronata TaxID=61149 RepID=A0A2P2NUN5_RHIMU
MMVKMTFLFLVHKNGYEKGLTPYLVVNIAPITPTYIWRCPCHIYIGAEVKDTSTKW